MKTLAEVRKEKPGCDFTTPIIGAELLDGTPVQVTAVLERTCVVVEEGEPKQLVRLDRVRVPDEVASKAWEHPWAAQMREAAAKGRRQTRLRSKGKGAKGREAAWKETVEAVMKRDGKCQDCQRRPAVDPHHCFLRGKSAQISGKYADHETLVCGLCRECHDFVQTHPKDDRTIALQWEALIRFAMEFQLSLSGFMDEGYTPLETIRTFIRQLEAQEAA